MINKASIETLLTSTRRLVAHQKEVKKLRGENFNIFSILKMESRENETHSAFLKELLDPKGSHLQGTKFLELFLAGVGYTGLDIKTAKVKVEHNAGKVDHIAKTGGRIDIYIEDRSGTSISIENKIWAGDQKAQIERYVNYNKDKNTVYYLTLNGHDPDDRSKGILESGKDFFTISYKEGISDWLESCMKEAVEIPILRETIKQYIILINKLTNSMDDKAERELLHLMLTNYEAAEYITSNFDKLKNEIRDSFRNAIVEELNKSELNDFTIELGSKISSYYSQIWINSRGNGMRYGIESFSGRGHTGGYLFIGVFVNDKKLINDSFAYNAGWNNECFLKDEHGAQVNLSKPDLLNRLFKEKDTLVKEIINQILLFIKDNPILV